jgi:menaquinone-dependent protoporphyrinogen oxidase
MFSPHGLRMAVRPRAGFVYAMTEQPNTDHRALVVYASTHGHTAKIAARVAEAIRGEGVDVDLRDVAHADDTYPASYDLVVVAASIHKEHHQKEIVKWAASRREGLQEGRNVFLSVSLSAAEDTDEAIAATQRCIDMFCDESGWIPQRTERIAGCLQYREYDFFTRQAMRMLMHHWGHPSDASHDYDYTDWDGLDRLGRELAATAGVAA